jgi:hypothetical protein
MVRNSKLEKYSRAILTSSGIKENFTYVGKVEIKDLRNGKSPFSIKCPYCESEEIRKMFIPYSYTKITDFDAIVTISEECIISYSCKDCNKEFEMK